MFSLCIITSQVEITASDCPEAIMWCAVFSDTSEIDRLNESYGGVTQTRFNIFPVITWLFV